MKQLNQIRLLLMVVNKT
ncbi:hypothetical protein Goarm_023282 [Gossypium armourianum]|uniref:Uncharacterized protein n=1 Tax=Gossypium armourianum TaxID=34283 RepID=A0A7J9KF98_9ROSI|nr:hypothetical protein [Gossypium armourianum]